MANELSESGKACDTGRVFNMAWFTRWRSFLIVLAFLEGLWLLTPPPSGFVERWYSQILFRWIIGVTSRLQDASPISLTSLALIVLAIAIIFAVYRANQRLRTASRSRWWLVPWMMGGGIQAAILLLLWMLFLWGAGYQRAPVVTRWALDIEDISYAEQTRLESELLTIIEADIEAAQSESRAEAIKAISVAMEELVVARGERPLRLPRQVRATLPGLFLANGTSGMCVPAFVEPFVDGAYDSVTFTQVAAHELGHVAGYNRESEATLLGYIAGLGAKNPLARYAVALDIYMDLIRRSPDRATFETAWQRLPEQARADVKTGREIARHYRINIALFQKVGYHVYDTYLKSQGIQEGMVNYSVGLRLFIGAWRQDTLNDTGPGEATSTGDQK